MAAKGTLFKLHSLSHLILLLIPDLHSLHSLHKPFLKKEKMLEWLE